MDKNDLKDGRKLDQKMRKEYGLKKVLDMKKRCISISHRFMRTITEMNTSVLINIVRVIEMRERGEGWSGKKNRKREKDVSIHPCLALISIRV